MNIPSRIRAPVDAVTSLAVWPYFLLVMAQVGFGSNQIMGKMVEGHVPPVGLSFWRWVFAVALILPFVWGDFLKSFSVVRRHWKVLALLAFSLVMLGNTTIYIALNFTTAINAGIIPVAQPAVTFLLSWLLFRDRLTPGQALGAAIAVAGVLTVLTKGELGSLSGLRFNTGDLWLLVSITGFSLYAVVLRKAPRDLSFMVQLMWIEIFGVLWLLPVYIWETTAVRPMEFNGATVAAVAWATLVVAIFAMVLWTAGVKAVGANKSSVFVYCRLFFITVAALWLLGETVEVYHFVAFAVILVGLWLVSRADVEVPG